MQRKQKLQYQSQKDLNILADIKYDQNNDGKSVLLASTVTLVSCTDFTSLCLCNFISAAMLKIDPQLLFFIYYSKKLRQFNIVNSYLRTI